MRASMRARVGSPIVVLLAGEPAHFDLAVFVGGPMRVTLSTTAAAPARIPRMEEVLKSRDVEDPVNLWVHRPLAYLFCKLVFRTRISPNQLTLLSIVLGVA